MSSVGLETVDPRFVHAWLRASGWARFQETDTHVVYRFDPDGSGSYEVLVPLERSSPSALRRMHEVLETVVAATGRSADSIVEQWLSTHADVVSFRLLGVDVRDGVLPLERGAAALGAVRDVMAFAAAAAADPRAVYRSRRPQGVADYLEQLQLPTTRPGSYVFSVRAPVPPRLQGSLCDDWDSTNNADEPFNRQVSLALCTALGATAQAARLASADGSLDHFSEGVPKGVSANFVEALATLIGSGADATLDIGMQFALARLPARPPTTRFTFAGELSSTLTEAARRMRLSEPLDSFEVRGVVRSLNSESPDQEGGTVKVLTPVDGALRLVEVYLEPNAYKLALQAHGRSQLLVCEGELSRQHNTWRLANARRVSAQDDTSAASDGGAADE
jgi:hypothetical protein